MSKYSLAAKAAKRAALDISKLLRKWQVIERGSGAGTGWRFVPSALPPSGFTGHFTTSRKIAQQGSLVLYNKYQTVTLSFFFPKPSPSVLAGVAG
jgi:hypothetical protein